jgi:DNA-binding NarL/FixJ family response regulator
MPIRVLLVDDHTLFRESLRKLLKQTDNITVVAEAQGGSEAIKLTSVTRPDLILMEVALPDINGVETTKKIISLFPKMKILALSSYSQKQTIIKMYQAGAVGYLHKDCGFSELARAIKIINDNHIFIHESLATYVVETIIKKSFNHKNENMPSHILTDQENRVLKLLVSGKSLREIGTLMSITTKTVSSHKRNLMKKMNVSNFAGLLKQSIRIGVTTASAGDDV